ncbi:MAG: L,D-transpeptidase [Deltaproteobacteria bacterium]|nr:L,D-transpeptidase [Deltaproteobacteria bacterium]
MKKHFLNFFKYILLTIFLPFIMGNVLFVPQSYEKDSSVVIINKRTQIKSAPSKKSKLRGIAVKGSRLPILETSEGDGCNGYQWYKVYEDSWICGRNVELSDLMPQGDQFPVVEGDNVSPWPYAFVKEQAIEYKWAKEGWLEEIREIFTGFGFAVQKIISIDGQKYYKTPEDKIIPTYAARYTTRISKFAGIELENGKPFPVGWIISNTAWAYNKPVNDNKSRIRQFVRFDSFTVEDTVKTGKQTFYKTAKGEWLSKNDVRVSSIIKRPETILPNQKWIDVDTNNQIATAYIGDKPVYSTLVSTGRKGPSHTKTGLFNIWVKVAAIAMDNTDEQEDIDTDLGLDTDSQTKEKKLYSLQDVPWSQFFNENYAIHAVYWHNGFGNRKSHGCINMSPLDARWFYNWTEPHLPDGWWSIYTMENEKGTAVLVR